MHPDNVLIRCPNSHELQAARSDLGKVLSCPVCNTTFSTGAPPASPPGPGGMTPPAAIDYAGHASPMLLQPVKRPQYVGWLVGLWIAVEVLSTISSFASIIGGVDPMKPSPLIMGANCFVTLFVIAAIVLQLMWIYRIHDDALRARGYRAVSPGMALGLSFIPVFNYIWTGWTMKKLAEFAASGERSQNAAALDAVRAATICFYFGIALTLTTCIGGAASGIVGFQSAMQAATQGPANPFASAGPGFLVVIAAMTLVRLVSVFVYAWVVKKLHASLYDSLGAPA
jgi:hypothetical protein